MGTPSICRPLPQNSQKWGFSGGKGCPFFDLQNAKRVKRGLKRAHFSLGATPAERRARLFQASQVWEIRAEDTQVMKKSPGGLRSTRRRENHWDQAKMCVRWAAAVDPRRRCGGAIPPRHAGCAGRAPRPTAWPPTGSAPQYPCDDGLAQKPHQFARNLRVVDPNGTGYVQCSVLILQRFNLVAHAGDRSGLRRE